MIIINIVVACSATWSHRRRCKGSCPGSGEDEPEVVASVRGRQHVNGIVEPVSQLLFVLSFY